MGGPKYHVTGHELDCIFVTSPGMIIIDFCHDTKGGGVQDLMMPMLKKVSPYSGLHASCSRMNIVSQLHFL